MKISKKKLVLLMLDNELSSIKLAEKAGITRVTISNIKAGKSCLQSTAKKLAEALNVDVTEILED